MRKQHLLMAILCGILFLLLSHPYTYTLSDLVLGSRIQTVYHDLPTQNGLLVHSILYAIIVFAILSVKLKTENKRQIVLTQINARPDS